MTDEQAITPILPPAGPDSSTRRRGGKPPAHASAPMAGDVVAGRYTLVRPLGQGGMGTVWLAEQTEPVRREVAVKLIRPGRADAEALARFDAERHALARMAHPHIARVYDAGRLPSGEPFAVLEYVPGEPIVEFCDARGLGVPERLRLLAQACRAVQHAHHRGVIHRDLKPANVLVVQTEGGWPAAKVIDFGIARPTEPLPHERLTEAGMVVGTPDYMSPEQTSEAGDVDTRTDVYALGALLHELLVGVTPFRLTRRDPAGPLEMLRRPHLSDAPRPSRHLLAQPDADAVELAGWRGTTPAALARLLARELDWVVAKALARDRERRYPSAEALADDLGHYLSGETVSARPPTAGYRLRKLAARNKAATVLAALLLVAVVAGAAATGVALARERAARADAERARDDAASALDAMTGGAAWETLAAQAELSEAQKLFLGEALAYYGRLAESGVSRRAADAAARVASIEYRLGRPEAAEACRRAERAYAELDPSDPEAVAGRARCLSALGLALMASDAAGAEAAFGEAHALFDAARAALPGRADLADQQAHSLNNLGVLLLDTPVKRPEAAALFRRSAEILGDGAATPMGTRALARSLLNLGILGRERPTEALRDLRRAAGVMADAARDRPPGREDRTLSASIGQTLSNVLFEAGRHAEAEAESARSRDLYAGLVRESPGVPALRSGLANARMSRGNALSRLRRPGDAEAEYRAARELLADLHRESPGGRHTLTLAAARNNLAALLRDARPAEAEAECDAAVQVLTIVLASRPEHAAARAYLAHAREVRCFARAARGDWRGALEDADALPGLDPKRASACRNKRLFALARVDPLAARREAEEMARRGGPNRLSIAAAALSAASTGLPPAERDAAARRAVELFAQATAAGLAEPEAVAALPEFDAVRAALHRRERLPAPRR